MSEEYFRVGQAEKTTIALESLSKKARWTNYLGASIIGKDCAAALWYDFRNATEVIHDARLLRIFDRGLREEKPVVELLRKIGCDVADCLKKQKWIQLVPFVGCTPDGFVTHLPEAPQTKHLLEIKTHSNKSFKKFEKDCLKSAMPMHYAQMQVGMFGAKVDRGLYFAVNKDSDEIYLERIELDKEFALNLIERAQTIVLSPKPFGRISETPAYYICKMCNHWEVCHNNKPLAKNCRTCRNVNISSEVYCSFHCKYLTPHKQQQGCRNYREIR